MKPLVSLALAFAFLMGTAATAQLPIGQSTETSLYDMALPAEPAARAKAKAAIEAAIEAPFRPTDHRVRDEQREARSILAVAAIEPGDKILDVGAGGGYLSLLASALAGETGRVDIHNTPGWIAQFPSMDPAVQKQRLNRPNLRFITSTWSDLPAEAASYDVILAGQVYHDAVLEGADIERMNQNFYRALKPGGRLVIEDHEADPAMPIGRQVGLHRIAVSEVMDAELAAGFKLHASLAIVSMNDDKRFNVFTPGIRGRTERFILVFEKPT